MKSREIIQSGKKRGIILLCPVIGGILKLMQLFLLPERTQRILWEIPIFCIMTAVICYVYDWLGKANGLAMHRIDLQLWKKGLHFFGMLMLIRFLMLIPFMLTCLLTVQAFRQGILANDAGIWLFLTIQGMTAIFWTGVLYLKFCLDLLPVPFLFLENPDCSPWKAVMQMLRRKELTA